MSPLHSYPSVSEVTDLAMNLADLKAKVLSLSDHTVKANRQKIVPKNTNRKILPSLDTNGLSIGKYLSSDNNNRQFVDNVEDVNKIMNNQSLIGKTNNADQQRNPSDEIKLLEQRLSSLNAINRSNDISLKEDVIPIDSVETIKRIAEVEDELMDETKRNDHIEHTPNDQMSNHIDYTLDEMKSPSETEASDNFIECIDDDIIDPINSDLITTSLPESDSSTLKNSKNHKQFDNTLNELQAEFHRIIASSPDIHKIKKSVEREILKNRESSKPPVTKHIVNKKSLNTIKKTPHVKTQVETTPELNKTASPDLSLVISHINSNPHNTNYITPCTNHLSQDSKKKTENCSKKRPAKPRSFEDLLTEAKSHSSSTCRLDAQNDTIREFDLLHPPSMVYEGSRRIKCAICLDQVIAKKSVVRVLGCLHVFHESCIDNWLKRSFVCPICRVKCC